MSMILEALRKSEAERQRGRAPGLFVEQRPAPLRERRVPAWAWALGALLLAVLLAWGWREWQRPAVVIVATAEPSADAVTEALPTAIAPRMESPPREAGSLAPITLAPAAPQVAVAPSPAPPAVASAPPAPAPPAAMTAPRSEAIGAPAPEPVAPPPDPVAYLPGLDALSAADRAALPPLKLSMHVYAEAPAQRFVILDGQRLVEGASPASGVVLEEIRRDGLVLSVNGQRLLLARP
jgi:general secretion pathway protein B